jgi:hypothetical protein
MVQDARKREAVKRSYTCENDRVTSESDKESEDICTEVEEGEAVCCVLCVCVCIEMV